MPWRERAGSGAGGAGWAGPALSEGLGCLLASVQICSAALSSALIPALIAQLSGAATAACRGSSAATEGWRLHYLLSRQG